MRLHATLRLLLTALLTAGIGSTSRLRAAEDGKPLRTLFTAGGSRVKTLDPAQADDLASRNMIGAVYDTLLQYDYTARPYRLIPSMLAELPRVNETLDVYTFRLRDDLRFADDPCFREDPGARRITARDFIYSVLRIADARNHSPVYWLFRGKIRGLDEFHRRTAVAEPGDLSVYEPFPEGFEVIDDLNFRIRLVKPDPRFSYMLAMPNAGVVSRRAVEFYGMDLARHPVGSGPFRLVEWINDYKVEFERNPDFRLEYFKEADTPADRTRPLPLADRLTFYLIKQPMSAWLLFLQGKLDLNALDKDNLDMVAGGGTTLAPALAERGIRLLRTPEFEVRYVGFNFADPKLGSNLALRKAISLAYDVQRRVEYTNFQLIPAQGPIPPGVAGYDPDFRNPFAADDVEKAKQMLAEAGYPGGIDPETGEPLRFTFDQTGNNSTYRQLGELTVADLARIGIEIEPVLNNNPRFYEKLRQGKLQLFRLSWVGDYPDAENFLQLFYSKNIGGCNRIGFSDPEFDRMFEAILPMPDSPERTRRYREMVEYLAGKVPWVFEGFPIAYQLNHAWLQNYRPHDFAFARWKYLTVDPEERERIRKSFRPLSFRELNAN